jgi:hypothetical protein
MQPLEHPQSPNELTTAELVARLQPGAWFKLGFLGAHESLDKVLDDDAETMARLGVSYDELANALDSLLEMVLEMYYEPVPDPDSELLVETTFPNFYSPDTIPHFDLDYLPDINLGYLVEHLQVFIMMYKEWHDCPWGCDLHKVNYDFMIVNRRTGESVTGTSLIPHLIRIHHFFGGLNTSYRTDPEWLVSVLGLVIR